MLKWPALPFWGGRCLKRYLYKAVALLLLVNLSACTDTPADETFFNRKFEQINKLLKSASAGVYDLALSAQAIRHQKCKSIYPDSRYDVFDHNLLYVPSEDGGFALWAPLNEGGGKQKINEVKKLECLEKELRHCYLSQPIISHSYVLYTSNIVFFFPFFKAEVFLTQDIDFGKDVLPFILATPQNNPAKNTVISPIFTDMLGTGLIASVSHPLYDGQDFLGIAGADISLDKIDTLFFKSESGLLFLTDKNGVVLCATPETEHKLGLSPASANYLDIVGKDIALDQSRGLINHSDPDLKILGSVISTTAPNSIWSHRNIKYRVLRRFIPSAKWTLVQLIKR